MRSSKTLYKEEAIPLVTYSPQNQRYNFNPEALAFIRSVPPPIGIVGVAGMYRTGKSFLLNRMILNRSDGFGVGPTINPCTKGLWIWGAPLKGETAKGEPINILVIDSEGIGALDEDSAHDTKIFSLTILFSSIFIYNSVGSIDENAINNLSLVINLTKHIHLNSGEDREIDPEEYGKFFPSFIWIIRDFTLRLVDPEGNSITSQQYLERSLATQEGFSDDTEKKNRIRRLLTTFFPDRECFCMVRPLTNEENLQNLNTMDMKKLRPEFYQQVTGLRNRLMSKMRPKSMNGKALSGEMLTSLMSSYLTAINEGSVPNIENAWTYLCQEQCSSAIQEAMEMYEKSVNEQVAKKMPMSLENLKYAHNLIKESVFEFYQAKDLGEAGEPGLKEVQRNIKKRFSELKAQNAKDSQGVCEAFLKKEFPTIEKKLKMNEYKNFADYDKDLKKFQKYILENGPDVVNKELIFLDFIQKMSNEGAFLFLKNMQNEIEIQRNISNEFQQKYEKEAKEVKEVLTKEKNALTAKSQTLEKQIVDLEGSQKELERQLNEAKSVKSKLEDQLKEQIEVKEKKNEAQISEMQARIRALDEELKEKSRGLLLSQSEFEKERVLIVSKSQNLEQMLEETKRKNKSLEDELLEMKTKNNADLRDANARLEGINKNHQLKISELTEKIEGLEREMEQRNQQDVTRKENYDNREESLKKSLAEANKTIDTLMKQVSSIQKENRDEMDRLKQEYDETIEALNRRVNESEVVVKQKSENLLEVKSGLDKNISILQQKLSFAESELADTKEQLTELKRAHEATIKAFEMNLSENKSLITEKDILQMKEAHLNEKKLLEQELQNQKKQMNQVIEDLKEKYNELELKMQIAENDYKKEIEALRQALEQAEETRNRIANDMKNFDSQKVKTLKDLEEKYLYKMHLLEDEVDELKKAHLMEIRALQAKFEENLRNLKELYEMDKLRLERKLADDKDRYERKYNQMIEEYETKIIEIQTNFEDEIKNLKEELKETEAQMQNMIQQYDHELNLRQKALENLEKLLSETKEDLNKEKEKNKQDIERLQGQWVNERNGLLEKIESINKELNSKENEILNLQQKITELVKQTEGKDDNLEKLKAEFAKEREDLNNKLEDLKKRLQALSDEYLEKKINYEKNAALSQQQIEFLNSKLQELQKTLEDTIRAYEDKIERLKEEIVREHQERLNQAMEDRNNLEQRHEKLKKSTKDQDAEKNKKINDLERERAILLEKNQQLQSRLSDIESKFETQIHHYNLQISQYKDSQESDKKPLLMDLEKYKALCLQFESEKNEILALYDKDRSLWEAKFNFLEQQREQAKADLAEAMKKFETTLENLQRARANEKSQNESTMTDMLLTLEKKYQTQINDQNEKHYSACGDYEDKIKKLEKELKALNDKLTLDTHGKLGNQILNEKKINELIENEKRMTIEIEEIKKERDVKIKEYQIIFDKERENLKRKIADIEEKLREYENSKSSLIFEHEKERAKWNIEKDHLLTEKADLNDIIQRLEKKKESLLRENEKLKNDAKSFRKVNNTIIIEKVQKNLNASSQNLNNLRELNMKPSTTVTTSNVTKISYANDEDEKPVVVKEERKEEKRTTFAGEKGFKL